MPSADVRDLQGREVIAKSKTDTLVHPMKIAVDAMGGDHAPREIVRGAVESARSNGLSMILVGQEERIRRSCARSTFPAPTSRCCTPPKL